MNVRNSCEGRALRTYAIPIRVTREQNQPGGHPSQQIHAQTCLFSGKGRIVEGVGWRDPLGQSFTIIGEDGSLLPWYFRKLDNPRKWLDIASSSGYQRLVAENLIVDATLFKVEFGSQQFMALGCPKLEQIGNFSFFPLSSRRLLALNWIRINKLLAKDNLALYDAHFENFRLTGRFQGIWVDHGSIVRLHSGWEGLSEFRTWHLRPLLISKVFPHYFRFVKDEPLRRATLFPLPLLFSRYLEKVPDDLFLKSLRILPFGVRKVLRTLILVSSSAVILAASSLPNGRGRWTKYKKNGVFTKSDLDRVATVKQLVDRYRAQSLLDVGANDGWVAEAFLKSIPRVIAVDPDESAIGSFAERVMRARGSFASDEVAALVGDFRSLDLKADAVLALALTHHLILGQGYSMEFVAQKLRDLTYSVCFVEFMPLGLGVPNRPTRVPEWYSLDNFRLALEKHFDSLVEHHYSTSNSHHHRILLEARVQSSPLSRA